MDISSNSVSDTPQTANAIAAKLHWTDRCQQAAQFFTLLLPIMMIVGKAPEDIACSLVAVLFLVSKIGQRDFAWTRHLWVRIILILWAYLVLRSLFAPDPLYALDRAAPWIRFPMFAIALGYWVITSREFSRRLFISICITAGLLCADALYQAFMGVDIIGREKFSADRLTGPFRQPRVGYTIAWIATPIIMLCLRWDKAAIGKSLLKLAAAAVICVIVLWSGDRTPTLLLFASLAAAAVLHPCLRRNLIWAGPLAVLVIGGFLYANPDIYERQVLSTRHVIENFTDSSYGKIALDSKEIILDKPLFGIGVQHYRILTANGTDALAPGLPHPHNFYLEIWTEAGTIGLVILLALVACWLKIFASTYRSWQTDFLMVGLVCGVLMRLWPIIANPSFYSSWNVIPMWMMVGWFFALLQLKQSEKTD